MPPRNPLEQLEIDACSPDPRIVDLFCYESMPLPQDLRPPVLDSISDWPNLVKFLPLSARTPPSDNTCWCLEQCNPEGICSRGRIAQPARKRKAEASPEPPSYSDSDDSWVQTFNLWHPSDFEKTIVEMDSNLPLRVIFKELCFDLRIDRKAVRFVWKRNRRRGGVESIVLKDSDAPWDVGMQQHNAETVECEYIS